VAHYLDLLLQIIGGQLSGMWAGVIVMKDDISKSRLWTFVHDFFEDISVPLSCDCLLTFQFHSLDQTRTPEEYHIKILFNSFLIFHYRGGNLSFINPQFSLPMSWGLVIVDISLITSDDLTDELMSAIFKDFLCIFPPEAVFVSGIENGGRDDDKPNAYLISHEGWCGLMRIQSLIVLVFEDISIAGPLQS
jgi:hypothetical protein